MSVEHTQKVIEVMKKRIAVMQAHLDGKEIEYIALEGDANSWESNPDPGWAWDYCDYRVAPPKPREVYIVWVKDGRRWAVRDTEDGAEEDARQIGGTYAKFVEVLP